MATVYLAEDLRHERKVALRAETLEPRQGGSLMIRKAMDARLGILAAGAVMTLITAACGGSDSPSATEPDPDPDPQPRDVVQLAARTYGDLRVFGSGRLRTWAETDGAVPVAIGISFTEESLDALTFFNIEEEFPESGTLWDHLGLDWNPNGHPPPAVYDVPHFDVHFYMIDPATRRAVPGGVDPVVPEGRYVPDGYLPDAISVPEMGVHWFDSAAPEFNDGAFTHTVIYGFTAGEMAFLEPMITRAFLETRTSVSQAEVQAEEVQRSGYYPGEFSIVYDSANRQYDLFLSSFVMREAS